MPHLRKALVVAGAALAITAPLLATALARVRGGTERGLRQR